jgi:hypothetical protein
MEGGDAPELGHGPGTSNAEPAMSSPIDCQPASPQLPEPFEAISSASAIQRRGTAHHDTAVADSAPAPEPSTGDTLASSDSADTQSLIDVYVTSYTDTLIPNTTRMSHAKSLALTLLQQYYPASGDFLIQPSPLGPMSRHGLNFMLKSADGTSPDFSLEPPKLAKRGKKRPAKAQLETERRANLAQCWAGTMSAKWHFIDAENIAGFQVLRKVGEELRPHTYLAIIVDDLTTLPFWASTNDVHRGDVLADMLCRTGQIRAGYGMLLFGTRLEVYAFDNGEPTQIDKEESEKYVEGLVHMEEPSVTLCKGVGGKELVVDLGTAGVLEEAFRDITGKEIEYIYEDADDEPEEVDESNTDEVQQFNDALEISH